MPQRPEDAKYARIAHILRLVLGLNLAVAGAKIGWGSLTGSLSMLADGLHSLFDSFSNIIGLVGIRVVRRPPDEDHPYGHRKFEVLTALGISMLLFLTCYQILLSVFQRFGSGRAPEVTPVSFAVMVATLVVNYFVSRYEARTGRELRSPILLADAAHTRTDLFASSAVIVALGAVRFDLPVVDLIAALGIVGIIAAMGYRIVERCFDVLADRGALPAEAIRRTALRVPDVVDVHEVRTRGMDDDIHIDFHITFRPDLPLSEAHAIAHRVVDLIQKEFPGVTDVVPHIEPEGE
jgi:cation diffusion facilitator family transporter